VIEDTLLMGADFYEPYEQRFPESHQNHIPIGIGENTVIRRSIVDKNARIGRDVQIINKDWVQEADREALGFYIRSGIVVVIKNATIPDGTVI
jgi:glucose-1-phosphate adenylyltransferase